MRRIHDQATCCRDRPGRQRRPAAIILALLFGLAACAPIKESEPPKTTASANPPVTTEKLPAPVALAPGMTGNPTAAPAATPSASPAAASPAPASPPAPALPAAAPAAPTPAAPAPAVAAAPPAPPAPPGVYCPLGTIGMWSQPDVIGKPVYICRQLNPPH